ncbi:MAG TPA: cytochrome o ubiquinol oxidase subunit III [Steroidobacteraceae bacterium]|nr:cytochrome o ubiquinol oxidase subunit III [Steroidobacteraceae bacterium]
MSTGVGFVPEHGISAAAGDARSASGPASIRITVAYGFWIFLLSDIIMFSTLFATYAVLKDATAGGPVGKDLFDLKTVGVETLCLLFSSYTCGIGLLSAEHGRLRAFYLCFALTFLLGAAFLGLEISEFARMVSEGAGPSRSAFLSGFFSLVGLHGLHVTAGLVWLTFMVAQTAAQGLRDYVRRRLHCFSLFWHALDIIWVALFTLVYLMGVQ